MITDFFAATLFLFLASLVKIILSTIAVFYILPVQVSPNILVSFAKFAPIWNELQNVFPMDVLFQVCLLVFATQFVVSSIKLILWLYKKIPFLGK